MSRNGLSGQTKKIWKSLRNGWKTCLKITPVEKTLVFQTFLPNVSFVSLDILLLSDFLQTFLADAFVKTFFEQNLSIFRRLFCLFFFFSTCQKRKLNLDLYRLKNLIAELVQLGEQRKKECINSLGSKGITPLMACGVSDFDQGASFLLEHGADINIRNNDGKCALTMATLHGNETVMSLLLAADKKCFTALVCVVRFFWSKITSDVFSRRNVTLTTDGFFYFHSWRKKTVSS